MDFDDNSFDVFNARYIQAFVLKTSWEPLMRVIMRILRPGGRLHAYGLGEEACVVS